MHHLFTVTADSGTIPFETMNSQLHLTQACCHLWFI